MTMVEILERSYVVPSEETPEHPIWLSNIDQKSHRGYTPTLYVYRPNVTLDLSSTADALRQALSKALVPFYPLAGQLDLDDDGRCEIRCTGKGILFVVARSEGTVGEFGDSGPSLEMRQVLVPIARSAEPPAAMLCMMQLTFFGCGGVTLGTAIHHMAVDGHGALHFIATLADIARGITNLPIKPHLDRSLLRARSPPSVLFDHIEYKSNLMLCPPRPSHVSAILKLTRVQVSLLKNSTAPSGKQPSTFRAVAAHVWRSVCIARALNAFHKSRLCITVNVRNRLNPALPSGFFGNAVCRTSAVATAGEIVSNLLGFAAEKIGEATDRVNDEYVRSAIDYMEMDRSPWNVAHGSSDLQVTSWLGMPVYLADFGWGRPEFMGPARLAEGFVYLMRSPADDGGVHVHLMLDEEVMVRFKVAFYKELDVLNGV